jgi:SAM-dependent methyltransferase
MDQMPPPDPHDELIPPVEMLHDGSSSRQEFVTLGESFTTFVLIPRTHLPPTAAVLDMGCGNGAVARALTRFLSPSGRYAGIDINAKTVAWLEERYRGYPNFSFTHANVWNKLYNSNGLYQPTEYRFPFEDASFDVVLLKSVFTHMLPGDVRAYMREVSRVLKPGGRAAISYFLLNPESVAQIDRGLDVHRLRFEYEGDKLCRVSNPEIPEAVTAHDETRIRGFYAEVGMQVVELAFGNWSGRATLLGHQDLVVAIKN